MTGPARACLLLPTVVALACGGGGGGAAPAETAPLPPAAEEGGAGDDVQEAARPALSDAIALLRAGDTDGAVEVLAAITARDPDDGTAWLLKGATERASGDLDAARASLERAAEIDETEARAHYQLAIVAANDGDRDGAFAWLSKAAASGEVDITGITADGGALLEGDERLAALMPGAEELDDPFVEDDVRVVQEWRGEDAGDQFGWIARNLGDVDGDGVADVVTSAPTFGGGAGKVYVYSSRSGKLVWSHTGKRGAQLGLGVEAAGDVDADGVPDVIAGAPGENRAYVFGGATGDIVLTLDGEVAGDFFGRKVSDVGDVDGDGHADVLVGAPRHDGATGAAYLYSGKDGAELLALRGERAGDRFGAAAAGVVDGDRVLLAVGAPDAGARRGGRVYVYRGAFPGAGGEPAFVAEADDTGEELGGMFISFVGDLDGDGTPDVYATDWSNRARGATTGRAYVYSGADGDVLHTSTGEAKGDGYGIGVADAGDVTGDGTPDLAIGAWRHAGGAPGGGKVYLYSGADGALIRTYTSKVMGETLGFDTTGLGDVDGDGAIDLLITSGWSPVAGARTGRVFILAGPAP